MHIGFELPGPADGIPKYIANLVLLLGHSTRPTQPHSNTARKHMTPPNHIISFSVKHAVSLRSLTLRDVARRCTKLHDIYVQQDDGSHIKLDPDVKWKPWSATLFRLRDLNLVHLDMYASGMQPSALCKNLGSQVTRQRSRTSCNLGKWEMRLICRLRFWHVGDVGCFL